VSAGTPTEGSPQARTRALIVIAALAVPLGILVAILASSGGSGESAFAAPGECLEAWNADESALSFARHNRTFHGSESALVGYLPAGSEPSLSSSPRDGSCAVVFGRSGLDPEAFAAGEQLVDRRWVPLSDSLEPAVLERLQGEALAEPNATPSSGGELQPASG
jgi:hypothetical protein